MRRTETNIFLSHCSVSPMHRVAYEAVSEFNKAHQDGGLPALMPFFLANRERFSGSFARLLQTDASNISAVHSTAAACNMLANDYPLKKNDEIVVYACEYPSNFYPWMLAAQRSEAKLIKIPDSGGDPERPTSFSIAAFEKCLSPKTKLVCLSHVQFSNGFCCDIEKISKICNERSIDFVLDATQSIGALAVYPEKLNIAAVISSGWKWLMGPHGIGVMYTSEAFRDKLRYSHGGPEMMKQGYQNLLDLSWNPHTDSRRFEYSTVAGANVHALGAIVRKVFLETGIETISQKLKAHHELLKARLDTDKFEFAPDLGDCFSPILAFNTPKFPPAEVCQLMEKRKVFLTVRGGFVRFAPHFVNTEEQITMAANELNQLVR